MQCSRKRGQITPGILPCALRAKLRMFKIAPVGFVSLHAEVSLKAKQCDICS
jgi:hypothetical protein